MDFITLAAERESLGRFLDEMLGGDEVPDGAYNYNGAGGGGYAPPPQQQQYQQQQYSSSSGGAGRPLLSKSAEAELYLLATNFLLYVAMVIITTIVAKIYFPESLERKAGPDAAHQARSYVYRRTTAGGADDGGGDEMNRLVEEEEYYGSDVDDLEDEDLDAVEEEEDGEEEGEDTDSDEVLDSGDEEEDPLRQRSAPSSSQHRHGVGGEDNVGYRDFVTGAASSGGTSSKHQSNRSSFLEFQQTSLTRLQVMRRLVFCCVMLNITFVAWGALQERMLTRRYPRFTGEYFTYSYALVFTNRFWTLIMSGILMLYLKPRGSRTTVIYEYSFPSISNLLSSWCQYEALRYVSFPATTLFKSFKLAPVMAMGKILGNKSYPQYDYFVALMIGIGIAMFMTSTDDLRFGVDYLGGEVYQSAAWTGVMLLFFYLFFDSFTSQFQSRMFQRHRDLSMVELMFATSAFSTVLSFVTLIHTKELYPAMEFVIKHSEIHLHFFLFSICSTIGQLFIFYTIRNFGAVVFTLIMTTRILLSIALSCVLYGHQVTATGFFGLVLVLGAVIYRIRRKAQGRQLLKWQGMEDDAKAYELVQEWHEHVDM